MPTMPYRFSPKVTMDEEKEGRWVSYSDYMLLRTEFLEYKENHLRVEIQCNSICVYCTKPKCYGCKKYSNFKGRKVLPL
jgi:hypothetical protein